MYLLSKSDSMANSEKDLTSNKPKALQSTVSSKRPVFRGSKLRASTPKDSNAQIATNANLVNTKPSNLDDSNSVVHNHHAVNVADKQNELLDSLATLSNTISTVHKDIAALTSSSKEVVSKNSDALTGYSVSSFSDQQNPLDPERASALDSERAKLSTNSDNTEKIANQSSDTENELNLSAEDLAHIEALRQKYGSTTENIEDEGSLSDLSAMMGLGRLGEDDGDSALSNEKGSFADFIMGSKAPLGSAADFFSQSPPLATDPNNGEISQRTLASSASLQSSTNNLLSNISPENLSAQSANFMRLEKLNQRNNDIMRNELQFKAGFTQRGNLPGSILFVVAEKKVYVDASSMLLLGLDLNNLSKQAAKLQAIEKDETENQPAKHSLESQQNVLKTNESQYSLQNTFAQNKENESEQNAKPQFDSLMATFADGDNAWLYNNREVLATSGKSASDFAKYKQRLEGTAKDQNSASSEYSHAQQDSFAESTNNTVYAEEKLAKTELFKDVLKSSLDKSKQSLLNEQGTQNTESITQHKGNMFGHNNTVPDPQLRIEQLQDPMLSSLGQASQNNLGAPYLKFLRLLGSDITHQLFVYLRLLHQAPPCLNPLRCKIELCPYGRSKQQRKGNNCPYVNADVKSKSNHIGLNLATDSINFELKIDRVNQDSIYLSVRAIAFYDTNGKVNSFSFILSQQSSRYFALVPNVLADNASFDWYVPTHRRTFSPNFYRMFGYPVNSPDIPSYMPEWIRTMIHPDEQSRVFEFFNNINMFRDKDCYEMYYRLKRADGNYFWTKITGLVTARDEKGHALRIIGSLSNINHVVDSYEKIRNKIYTDVLTGLKNRAYMQSQLPHLLHPMQQPLGIIFVDATALKLYNDYLSHTTGDRLLITLTSLLNHCIPNPKDLIRLSGDEFVCLIPSCTSERLKKIESAIIESRRQYNTKAPVRMPVFFSFGSSVLDLRESLYRQPELQNLKADEELPKQVMTDAKELFYLAVQASDLQMQYYKRHNKQVHYELIKAYIENILQYSISLNDTRVSMTVNK